MDFTNAVGHPRLTVITPVGMDHVPVLGTTLAEIAREKAGIIKAGCPLVCGRQEAPALDVIKDCARRAGVPAVYLDDETIEIISDPGKNIDFSMKSGYHGKYTFSLNTTAVYQAENAALAVAALKELWKDPLLADEPFIPTVSGGLARTRWPGRMEALGERFYVDGAHNVAGIDAFVKNDCPQLFQTAALSCICSSRRQGLYRDDPAAYVHTESEGGRGDGDRQRTARAP